MGFRDYLDPCLIACPLPTLHSKLTRLRSAEEQCRWYQAIASCAAVVSLTDSNFHSEVQGEDLWMVEFYAPWCGHCKNLKSDWEQLAAEVAGKAKIGAVDCTAHQSTCQVLSPSTRLHSGFQSLAVLQVVPPPALRQPREKMSCTAF